MIGAKTHVAVAAFNQRIGERINVAGGLPDFGVHQNSRVDEVHFVWAVDEEFDPFGDDVALQNSAEGAVVPSAGQAAINFTALINKTTAFAEADYVFEFDVAHYNRL